MKAYLGIDVGGKGFITLCKPDGEYEFFSIEAHTPREIDDFLKGVKSNYQQLFCAMEEIHAIFGSAAKATFSFGEINGLLKGLLIANSIPFELVQPKKWQDEIWGFSDKVFETKVVKTKDGSFKQQKRINTKQTSFNAAARLFPSIDLRKSQRSKNLDDNKCDSLLICEYARRKNL